MNDVLTSTYTIAMLCFVIGICTGLLIKHIAGSPERQRRKLSQDLDVAEKEHLFYQGKVSNHMSKLHDLSEKLGQLQRQLHHQLLESDAALFPDAKSILTEQELETNAQLNHSKPSKEKTAPLAAPMDYACKLHAGESKE
jgi:uncharacterized membrane-anchored protein YhcB (DUF1043 family)